MSSQKEKGGVAEDEDEALKEKAVLRPNKALHDMSSSTTSDQA